MPHARDVDELELEVVLRKTTLANVQDVAVAKVVIPGDQHKPAIDFGSGDTVSRDRPDTIIVSFRGLDLWHRFVEISPAYRNVPLDDITVKEGQMK
jgi:hypothetical protein